MTPRGAPGRDGRKLGAALLLALLALALAVGGGGTTTRIVAVIAAAAAGVLLMPAVSTAAEELRPWLDRARIAATGREGITDRRADRDPTADDSGPAPVPAGRTPSASDDALALVRRLTGASRVTLWQLDAAADRLDPLHSTGVPPGPRRAAGDPLAWCIRNEQSLRVDPRPRWAEADVVAVPADPEWLLGVTFEGVSDADPEGLETAARIVARMAMLDRREADLKTDLGRIDSLLALLHRIPGDPGQGGGFADALAGVAVRVLGARGAVIASWSDEAQAGEVVAAASPGEGPEPGTRFEGASADLGLAARSGTTLFRGPDRATSTLAGGRHGIRARHTVSIPLAFAGRVQAVVGAWGDRPPSRIGAELLTALGPVLALQLHQSADLDRFRERATRDPLTGLPNRAGLDEHLACDTQAYDRYGRPIAALMIDLDHFKRINDTHGHPAGDAVLRAVADTLRAAIRDVDFPARVGGEEIAVLLPETMVRQAGEVAERVRAAIARVSVAWNGTAIPVTASIGVSACPECVDMPDALLASADEALYRSKVGGRNRVTLAPPRTAPDRGPVQPAGG